MSKLNSNKLDQKEKDQLQILKKINKMKNNYLLM